MVPSMTYYYIHNDNSNLPVNLTHTDITHTIQCCAELAGMWGHHEFDFVVYRISKTAASYLKLRGETVHNNLKSVYNSIYFAEHLTLKNRYKTSVK
jgi:hypothetical protein